VVTGDIITVVMGILLGVMAPVIAWISSMVLSTRERVLVQEQKMSSAEANIAESKKDRLTTDIVREIVETALDRREAREESRKAEIARMLRIEIKQAVGEELEKHLPSIVRQVLRESDEEEKSRVT